MDDARVVQPGQRGTDRRHEVGHVGAQPAERGHALALLHLGLLLPFSLLLRLLALALGIPLDLVSRANLDLALSPTAQHLTHTPPLDALHRQRASRLVDPEYARHDDASLRAAREGSGLELQPRLGQ